MKLKGLEFVENNRRVRLDIDDTRIYRREYTRNGMLVAAEYRGSKTYSREGNVLRIPAKESVAEYTTSNGTEVSVPMGGEVNIDLFI